jgi:opacity protein-like surface antigen
VESPLQFAPVHDYRVYRMKIRVGLLALALTGLSAPAAANEFGVYVAGYVGHVSKDSDAADYSLFATEIQDFIQLTPATDQRSFDDAGVSFAVGVGYRLTRHLALEGTFTRLGEVKHTSRARGTFFGTSEGGTLDTSIESETKGFTLAALGFLPLNRQWELYGRAGALFATNKLSVSIITRGDNFIHPIGERVSDSFSSSTTEYFAGLGISRTVFEIYALRLEYQRFFDAGKVDTGGIGDIDAVMLGLSASF